MASQSPKLRLMFKYICVLAFTLSSGLAGAADLDHGFIDVRSSAIYNGWSGTNGEPGGHLPSAINLGAAWVRKMSDENLKDFLLKKKIDPMKAWTIYGNPKDTKDVSLRLKRVGYKNLKILETYQNRTKQFVKLKRYQKLVSAEWLNSLIDGKSVEAPPAKNWMLFEVAWGAPGEYLQEHIPMAGYFDTDLIEVGPIWNKRSDKELEANLLKMGIDADTPVILYSRDTIAAARVALILLYVGVKDVRLLDGGMTAWKNLGARLAKGPPPKVAAKKTFGLPIPANPQFIVSIDQAKQLLKTPNKARLVSIRSWQEHIGETSGYADIIPKGDIPGAVWGHGGSDAHHMEDFRNPDNTMISPEDILNYWHPVGINEKVHVSFYCGTGWRAAETFFYAYVMGWDNISVYDGGWKEWTSDPKNPITSKKVF